MNIKLRFPPFALNDAEGVLQLLQVICHFLDACKIRRLREEQIYPAQPFFSSGEESGEASRCFNMLEGGVDRIASMTGCPVAGKGIGNAGMAGVLAVPAF